MEYIIYRDGLNIYRDGGNEIDGRGASNVPFNVIYNGSGVDEYENYEIQLHYSYKSKNKVVENFVLANSNGMFAIPASAFLQGGNLAISLKFVKGNSGEARTSTQILNYNIKNNPDGSQAFVENNSQALEGIVTDYLDKLVQQGSLSIEPKVDSNGYLYFGVGN